MKQLFILPIFLLLMATLSQAQQRTIAGVVTDPAGIPLPGVTVLVKATEIGTASDENGRYALSVPEGYSTLVFSFTGFDKQEVALGGQNTLDIWLKESTSLLDEVVVIGFGTQSRRRLTSSISSAGEEVFRNMPTSDIQNALQGRMAGVVFTNSSGSTNSASSIRIRGVGSISASNQPIIVVDGLVLSGRINVPFLSFGNAYAVNPFINLNPNDIESVEVLKDAAASAIYGSRGSNGVILITTKKGDFNAQPKVSIGYWAGFSEASKTHKLLNGKEYAASWNQAALNAGRTPQTDPDYFTMWNRSLPRTGWLCPRKKASSRKQTPA